MAEIDEILEQEQQPLGLDLVELYKKGLEYLEGFSGELWNDFNAHDPGVTILEQLCNALVDLYFRSSLDIQSILLSEGRKVDLPKASSILSCNPLTKNDLRKKILYDVPEINNVWVSPVSEKENSFRGIYNLWLDIDLEKSGIKKSDIIQRVRSSYYKYRNLCEDISDIHLLKPLKITLNASIEVDESRAVEDIYADILYKIQDFLRPSVRFYQVDEIEQDVPTEKLYEGPFTGNIYIKDEDLAEKPQRVLISDLIKIASEVEGVKSVRKLSLENNGKIHEDQLIVHRDELPHLENIPSLDKGKHFIVLSSASFTYHNLNEELVKRKIDLLGVETGHKELVPTIKEKVTQQALDFKSYYSIQYDLPEAYGVGEMGLKSTATKKARASANQLKAYLLLFEQIMANYLTWLSNLNLLFSVDENMGAEQLVQPVEIFQKKESIFYDDKFEHIQTAFWGDQEIPRDYQSGIKQLIKNFVDFTDKQNRFLDYFLAINGEAFPNNILQQTNSYFSRKELQRHLLEYKKRMVYWLPEINKNRAQGFNLLNPDGQDGISGVQIKAALMLGFEAHFDPKTPKSFVEPHLADSFLSFGYDIIEDEEATNLLNLDEATLKEISEKISTDVFDYVPTEEYGRTHFTMAELKQVLKDTVILKEYKVFKKLFKDGSVLKNYLTGTIGGTCYLVFQKFGEESWYCLGTFDSEYTAGHAAVAMCDYFRQINLKAEGMYMIEHTLLRPHLNRKLFGIYILDQEGEIFLCSDELYTNTERSQVLYILEKEIHVFENFQVNRVDKGIHEIIFTDSSKTIVFKSLKTFESVQETYEKLEKTFHFLSDKYEYVPYEYKYSLFVQYKKSDKRIPEAFFSHRATVILPDWTNRFSKKEFREIAKRMIRNLAPAYVSIDFCWLSLEQLRKFEMSYSLWKESFRTNDRSVDNVLNKRLLRYLLEFEKE